LADVLLRLAVLGHALGIATAIYLKLGSGLGSYFFLEWGYSHPQVAQAERWVAAAVVALALLACWRPHAGLLIPLALAVLADAWARQFNDGAPFAEWTIGAHAPRYLVPLALALLWSARRGADPGGSRRAWTAGWILRIALAVVFITHGLEALRQHPRFIDYLIGTTDRWTPLEMSEATAVALLRGIGVVDVLVGCLAVLRPAPPVLVWMALWGAITAWSRVTSLGAEQFFEVLLRSAHLLAPLALLSLSLAQTKGRSPGAVPGDRPLVAAR
jgi:uncharacterized membrane protein YphA (DoxX/SURF4 family)